MLMVQRPTLAAGWMTAIIICKTRAQCFLFFEQHNIHNNNDRSCSRSMIFDVVPNWMNYNVHVLFVLANPHDTNSVATREFNLGLKQENVFIVVLEILIGMNLKQIIIKYLVVIKTKPTKP